MASERDDDPQSDLPVGLSEPARRALLAAGRARLEQVAGLSEAEVRGLHGVGPKAVDQLRGALADRGLAFSTEGQRRSSLSAGGAEDIPIRGA